MAPSSFSRFYAADGAVALPATIGSVSTASLSSEDWNEFWGKLSLLNTDVNKYNGLWFSLEIFGLIACFFVLHSFDNDVFSVIIVFGLLIAPLSVAIRRKWNSICLSKIQNVVADYAPSFQAAGFRVECQHEQLVGSPPGYYIYFYPISLDFLRVEIANETIFGCSSTKQQPVFSSNDYIPNAVQSVAPETWEQFWTLIEKDAGIYVSSSRRSAAAPCTCIILCVVGIAIAKMGLMNSDLLFFLLLGIVIIISLLSCFFQTCDAFPAMERLRATIIKFTDLFKQQGVELELRQQYDWSFSRVFYVTGNLRWCLYMFPLPRESSVALDTNNHGNQSIQPSTDMV